MRVIRVIGRPPARRLAAAIVVPALLAAGCGGTGSSTPSSSSSAAGSGSSAEQEAAQASSEGVAYSACMRAHGVPGYPDPKVSVNGAEVKVAQEAPAGAIADNPRFNSAQRACHKLLPHGGPESGHQVGPQEQAQYLRLVACMRSHGLPSLPDPTFSNGGVHIPGGVDHNSPQFKSAEQACASLIPAGVSGGGS